MTTLILTIDDQILATNRKIAAAQGKSLEQFLADYLAANAAGPSPTWAHDFLTLAAQAPIPTDGPAYKFKREDAYE